MDVIRSVSLNEEEIKEYDAENIQYFMVRWINNTILCFRDYCSVIVLSDFVRVINNSMIDDWKIEIRTGDSKTEILQRTNPSLFNNDRFRLFGRPCQALAEYYVLLMRGEKDNMIRYGVSQSLHCDIDNNVVRFSLSDRKDVIDDEKAYLINYLLDQMYGHFFEMSQTTIRSDGPLDGNLLLIHDESTNLIDMFRIEMPVVLGEDRLGWDKDYALIPKIKSPAFYNYMTDDVVYRYELELPMTQDTIVAVTGIEIIPK